MIFEFIRQADLAAHGCAVDLVKPHGFVLYGHCGGYGIGNILERLHIYYDDDFMFEIDSAILVGTTVTIRVPYSRNDSPQIHAERPIGGAEQNGCFISIFTKILRTAYSPLAFFACLCYL